MAAHGDSFRAGSLFPWRRERSYDAPARSGVGHSWRRRTVLTPPFAEPLRPGFFHGARGVRHTKKKSPSFGVAPLASVMVSVWASMPEKISHWLLPIGSKLAPSATVPKPLNTRTSPSLLFKSATVAPSALPAESTNMSLPPSPTRVFAVPKLTRMLAPLLPVPVSPEPVRYIVSTLVGRV